MMSAVYGRQMPANGGQIDNLGAFQRHILGCADLDVLRIRLVVLSEAAIIEIESDPKFDPPESSDLKMLARRSAPNLRAE